MLVLSSNSGYLNNQNINKKRIINITIPNRSEYDQYLDKNLVYVTLMNESKYDDDFIKSYNSIGNGVRREKSLYQDKYLHTGCIELNDNVFAMLESLLYQPNSQMSIINILRNMPVVMTNCEFHQIKYAPTINESNVYGSYVALDKCSKADRFTAINESSLGKIYNIDPDQDNHLSSILGGHTPTPNVYTEAEYNSKQFMNMEVYGESINEARAGTCTEIYSHSGNTFPFFKLLDINTKINFYKTYINYDIVEDGFQLNSSYFDKATVTLCMLDCISEFKSYIHLYSIQDLSIIFDTSGFNIMNYTVDPFLQNIINTSSKEVSYTFNLQLYQAVSTIYENYYLQEKNLFGKRIFFRVTLFDVYSTIKNDTLQHLHTTHNDTIYNEAFTRMIDS